MSVYRIGEGDQNRIRPRPVKLTLKEQTKRDPVLIFKSGLHYSENLADIRINKDARIKADKLRQAGADSKKTRPQSGISLTT